MPLFLGAKLSYILLTFILTNSIMAVELRKSVRSASYHLVKTIQSLTTEQPQHLSAEPWVFLNFFPQSSPPTQYLFIGWVIPLASFSRTPTQYLSSGWKFLVVFQPSPTQCLALGWLCPECFTHPQYLSNWEGAGNLLHHQIKLRISTNTGDSRTRRDLPKFICIP